MEVIVYKSVYKSVQKCIQKLKISLGVLPSAKCFKHIVV